MSGKHNGGFCTKMETSDTNLVGHSPRSRGPLAFLLISFPIVLAVWFVFSWPLPKHVMSAIPISAQNVEKDHLRAMIPGDQLQLMYHFWLFADMVRGNTPLFYNIYEFNTGNDKDRFNPESYFFPFSLIFAIGDFTGYQAFGWNLTAFVSLWLTFWLSWLLLRRFSNCNFLTASAALISIALPYRWAQMLGGSPTGLAMMLVPMMILSLDIAIRDEKPAGSWLAGLTILFAAWTDTHVFFFSCISLPIWVLALLTLKPQFKWLSIGSYLKALRWLWPVALLAIIAFVTGNLMTAAGGKHEAKPRTDRDLLLFSGHWTGFFNLESTGPSSHIYLGYGLAALVLLSVVCTLLVIIQSRKDPSFNQRYFFFLIIIFLFGIGIISLGLGPNGPMDGLLMRAARKLIPQYQMIRQSAKVYCLLPICLMLVTVLPWQLAKGNAWAKRLVPVWILCLVVFIVEARLRTDASLTSLDYDQGAYRSVAEDARQKGEEPHALVIPLWPGDSHYTSIYQYYCSLYRIRMINGYRPFLPEGYFENVFQYYESANQGKLSDRQADKLLASGIDYIILHENIFPEKVSPFPVGATLQNLLNNPRLEMIAHDSTVWAFRILSSASTDKKLMQFVKTCFPARNWEFENYESINSQTNLSGKPGYWSFVELTGPESSATPTPVTLYRTYEPYWLFRARGPGSVTVDHTPLVLETDKWIWYRIPVTQPEKYGRIQARVTVQSGKCDADSLLLAAGEWKQLEPGQTHCFSVPEFFHGGYTSDELDAVVFRERYDPVAVSLYGPQLPLDPGTYRIDMETRSDAVEGTVLGRYYLKLGTQQDEPKVTVLAGKKASVVFEKTDDLPFRITFVYDRNADMAVTGISLTRVK